MSSLKDFSTVGIHPAHNDSAAAAFHSTPASCLPAHAEQLLTLDLNAYRSNVEKLLLISKDLQQLCISKNHELKRLRDSSDLTTQTRRSDSGLSKKPVYMDTDINNRRGTRVVYSPLNNGLTLRPSRTMKDEEYIRAELPSFNPWSDTLHIYYEKSSQHPFIVTKKLLLPTTNRDVTFIRTIKLGRLGMRVKLRRVFGQLDEIYVHFPPS